MIPFVNVKKESKSSVIENWLKGFDTVINNVLIFIIIEKCS